VGIDRRDEVKHVTVVAGRIFDPLDHRFDRLALGVGHLKLLVRQDIFHPFLQHHRHFHHRLTAEANRSRVPTLEKRPCSVFLPVEIQIYPCLLERPGPRGFQVGVAQCPPLLVGERCPVTKPRPFRFFVPAARRRGGEAREMSW